ncbi:MAG: hypothetical protein H0V18_15890 [Pyrinomonadaceae bacterium]|nr:hypothetical protein [Pyrinomonadaceae bacterium]
MEFNGEEKTIRALFREMKLEDERATPTFAREGKRRPSRPGAQLSLGRVVFAVALVCLILGSTLLLRRHFFWTLPLRQEFTKQLEMDGRPDQQQVSRRDQVSQVNKEARKLKSRTARRRRLDGASRNARLASSLRWRRGEASFVSDWQSPTGAFLRSPGDELLRSLPQLNQSSLELGSFLNSRLN